MTTRPYPFARPPGLDPLVATVIEELARAVTVSKTAKGLGR